MQVSKSWRGGKTKEKARCFPSLEGHGDKEQFQREDAEGTGAAGENSALQGAVPWDVGRGPGDNPLSLNSVP